MTSGHRALGTGNSACGQREQRRTCLRISESETEATFAALRSQPETSKRIGTGYKKVEMLKFNYGFSFGLWAWPHAYNYIYIYIYIHAYTNINAIKHCLRVKKSPQKFVFNLQFNMRYKKLGSMTSYKYLWRLRHKGNSRNNISVVALLKSANALQDLHWSEP